MATTNKVTAIRGDYLEYYFVLNSIDSEMVNECVFTCNGQGICVHLPYSEDQGGWCLRLTSNITCMLKPKTSYYDLTAELIDGNNVTVIYNGIFAVKNKFNKPCYEEEEEE